MPTNVQARSNVWSLPHIKEEQTTQWPKEKVQKDKLDLENIYIKLKIE
jgi:hypothetical protein